MTVENLYAPLQGEITAEIHFDIIWVGVVSSSYLVALAIVQIPAGLLVDRWGPGRLMPVVVVLSGVSALVLSWSESLAALILGRALAGASMAFCVPVMAAVCRRAFPLALFALLIAIGEMAVGASGFLGVYGGNLVETILGWRQTFLATAAASILVAALSFFALRGRWFGPLATQVNEPSSAAPDLNLRSLLRRPNIIDAVILYAAGCGTMIGFGGIWNLQLAEAWEWKENDAAFIVAFFFVGISLGSPACGWLATRFGSRATILWMLGLAIPAYSIWLLIYHELPPWIDALNVGFFGACLSCVVLAFEVACRDLPAEKTGSVTALVALSGTLAGVVLEIAPGILCKFAPGTLLFKMQISNGIFGLTLLLAFLAATRIPKGT